MTQNVVKDSRESPDKQQTGALNRLAYLKSLLNSITCWYHFIGSRIPLMLKNFQMGFSSPSITECLVGMEYLFSQEGRLALKKRIYSWYDKMKRKNILIVHRWNFKQNWHASFLIIWSKLNLLTEPENKNKQAAWIILLLSVNCTFLEKYLQEAEFCIKKTRCVGMKVSNYPFHIIMQIQANFTTIATLQVKVFTWSPFYFRETFHKSSSVKLHGNRKGSDHITCEFPVYPRSNT